MMPLGYIIESTLYRKRENRKRKGRGGGGGGQGDKNKNTNCTSHKNIKLSCKVKKP